MTPNPVSQLCSKFTKQYNMSQQLVSLTRFAEILMSISHAEIRFPTIICSWFINIICCCSYAREMKGKKELYTDLVCFANFISRNSNHRKSKMFAIAIFFCAIRGECSESSCEVCDLESTGWNVLWIYVWHLYSISYKSVIIYKHAADTFNI